MPFKLKNVGTTYQKAIVTFFHNMMHKEIEVYVDDMIVKSREGERVMWQTSESCFEMLRKYQLKLNHSKCTFGGTSKKLLGFIVSSHGIEVDPSKIKAIHDMPVPCTQKEVKGFMGRLNYISQFISHLMDKYELIFKLLKKHDSDEWNMTAINPLIKSSQRVFV